MAKWAPSLDAAAAGTEELDGVILLNSHYDVVPVMTEHWTMPAFDGLIVNKDGEDRIYGRGVRTINILLLKPHR